MKTINIVCHYSSLYGGNFIPSVLFFANSNKDKFKILFTFPIQAKDRYWANYITNNGFKIVYIDFSTKRFKKEIKSVNKKNNVDIMYTHFLSGLRIKQIYPFSKKTKLIIHVHSDFTGGNKPSIFTKIKIFVEHKVLRRDAQYIFVSEDERNKFSNKKYLFLPNALSLERVPCQKFDVNRFKEEHQIPNDATLFLMFGWSPFVKGVDIAVKSFLKNANSKNRLIIVHGKDDGYQKCVNFLAEKLGGDDFLKDNRIIFCKPKEDVFSLYSLCDVFVSSSRSEGFSYSILEALYFNLKVISSDIIGVRWSKKYNKVSFFDINNEEQLKSLLLAYSGFKKTNSVNEEILKDFDIKKWSETLSTQFRKIVN